MLFSYYNYEVTNRYEKYESYSNQYSYLRSDLFFYDYRAYSLRKSFRGRFEPVDNRNILEKFFRFFRGAGKVALSGRESYPQFFGLRFFLFAPATFAVALFPLVFELPEVHDFADRGVCGG